MTSLPQLVMVLLSAVPGASDAVILDFTATWCGPCQQMSPMISRLERQGHPIRKVDVDREPELARRFGIQSIPAFVLVVNGKEVTRLVGAVSESKFRETLIARIPTAEPANIAQTGGQEEPRPPLRSRDNLERPEQHKSIQLPVTEVAETTDRGAPFRLPFFGKRSAPKEEAPPVVRAKHDGLEAPLVTEQNRPQAASTRIRVVDGEGVNFGSGTVIASRPGWSLVVTCGHIFRQLTKDSRIEVDVFIDGRSETFVGSVVQYDLEADVGLIKIPTETAFPSVPLADLSNRPTEGAAVFSIGCGGGEPPTRQDLTVTSLNRYLGPANIECSGVPVQGRSGGGLFNPDGELVGVCVAADPHDRRGLYAALSCVDELLDRCQLAKIVRAESPTHMPVVADVAASEQSHFENASRTEVPADLPAHSTGDAGRVPSGWSIAGEQAGTVETQNTPPFAVEPSAGSNLDALLETVGDAEVVCIIRPRNQPNAPSRVVVINRASPKFVSYLTGEVTDDDRGVAGTTTGLQPASIGVTMPPTHSQSREQMQPSMQETSHRVNTSADSGYGHSAADRFTAPTVEETKSLRPALPSAIRPQRYQRSR